MFEVGLIVGVLFCLGAAIGSFLHVMAERYLSEKSAFKGRSECPVCHKTLGALEMIPIISYVLLGAKCKGCRTEIPAHYPMIEFLTAVMASLLLTPAVSSGVGMLYASLVFVMACILIVLIRIDSKSMLLPDGYIWTLTGVSIAAVMVRGVDSADAIFGVLVGSGFLYLLWIGTSGRGIGFGDVKLMIPLGIFLGLFGTIALLFFAFFVGGAVSVFLLASKQVTAKTAIPFGPFLAGAALVCMVFPEAIDRFFAFLGVY